MLGLPSGWLVGSPLEVLLLFPITLSLALHLATPHPHSSSTSTWRP
jgi:hypothetical protein